MAMLGLASRAVATPGIGDPVYGAGVTKGLVEIEARYGRLTGGSANGDDGLILEGEYGLTKRLLLALLFETGRTLYGSRQINAFGIEAKRTLGRIDAIGVDTALYLELKHGFNGSPDVVEVKGLFEHAASGFDARFNLIGEKSLSNDPVEFGYAASVDWAVIGDEFRLGAAAFGDFGTATRFAGREQHFIGPEAKFEIEHLGRGELEIEAGYLFAVGAARDTTRGQARLLVSYEAKF